ncbi:hypothetical protein AALB_0045 [Agarivorans albus MKT 106]|uniref:Uncharacterized protein n=1 Tax=Agarivorans albus MKT 106 TaxID=1331007 RepID=R9PF11_AGAAL|nr:hypothetical protein AALB_0045 [Agarivorans albus MKT 106]
MTFLAQILATKRMSALLAESIGPQRSPLLVANDNNSPN